MTKPGFSHRRKTRSTKHNTPATDASGATFSIVESQKIEYAEDPCHNSETPFCQMLSDLAYEVVALKNKIEYANQVSNDCGEASSSSGLALLIRDYLISEMRQDTSATGSKKRRHNKNKITKAVGNSQASEQHWDSTECVRESKFCDNRDDQRHAKLSHILSASYDLQESSNSQTLDRFLHDRLSSLAATRTVSGNKNTLRLFLETVLSQQEERCSNRYSLRSQIKKSLPSTEYGCHVMFSQVQAALTAIACPNCRGAVRKVLLSDFCLEVSNPLGDSTTKADSDSSAFDYIAMEEGTSAKIPVSEKLIFRLVTKRNNRYENGDILGPSAGWHLRRASFTSNNGDITSNPWTVEDIMFMIKHYVLGSGFHPDVVAGAVTLSDETISSICRSVDSRVSSIAKEFRDIAKELEIQVEKFVNQQGEDQRRVELQPEVVNIDMRSFPVMLETDKLCCTIIERLLSVVLDVTNSVRRIVAHNTAITASREEVAVLCAWATDPCKDLWQAFWQNVDGCCEYITVYERELFSLGDRLGNIPAKYLNSRSRAVYRTLVDAKIRVVHKMLSSIDRIMNHESQVVTQGCIDWSTTFMKKTFTVESFCKVLCGIKQNNSDPQHIVSCTENVVEQKLEEILRFAACTWPKTIQDDNTRKIIATQTSEMNELVILLHGLKNVSPNNVLSPHVDLLVTAIETKAAELRPCFGSSMIQMLSDWMLHAECEVKLNTGSVPLTLLMPLKLTQAMVEGLDQPCVNICDGKSGKRRAVGVLVGLFFKGWLLERYREWYARRAEEELLTTIAGELVDNLSSTQLRLGVDSLVSKKGVATTKKSKKKKGKKIETESIASDSELVPDEKMEVVSENVDMAQAIQTVSVDEGFDPFKTMTSQGASVNEGQAEKATPSGLLEVSEQSLHLEQNVENVVFKMSVLEFEDENMVNHFSLEDVEAHVNVLVHTSSGFQSAEEYLLHRFSSVTSKR